MKKGEIEKFEFSGEPNSIYHYKCFHDPSSKNWIDGAEYIKNSHWTDDSKNRWHFFYRPYNYKNLIAPKQKELIQTNDKKIHISEHENLLLYTAILITALFTIWMAFTLPRSKFDLSLIPAIICLSVTLKAYLNLLKIEKLQKDNRKLNHEIAELLKQQAHINETRLKKEQVHIELWEDIKDLENIYLHRQLRRQESELEHMDFDFYHNIKAINLPDSFTYPHYPVIQSWGALQPTRKKTTHELKPGVQKIIDELGKKVATWRHAGTPFYRLWFLTFIFFSEKSIDVVSVHYDFITKKTYGKQIETYYYNHIASCSYEQHDIPPDKKDLIIQEANTPTELADDIAQGDSQRISFSSASMKMYECILPGEETIDALIDWAKLKDKEILAEKLNLEIDDAAVIRDIENDYRQTYFVYNNNFNNPANEFLHLLRQKVEEFSIKETAYESAI